MVSNSGQGTEPAIRLVMFDMDGVIFEGDSFWLDLHRTLGTEKEGLALAQKFLKSDYQTLARLVMENLWRGRDAGTYYSLINDRQYHPHIDELFKFLHRRNIYTGIVSSGPYELALRAKTELGIDLVRANRLEIANGVFTGEAEIAVEDGSKDLVGREIAQSLGIELGQAAYVADDEADVELCRIVGLPISYNSKSRTLDTIAKYILPCGHLDELPNIIDSYRR